MVVLSAHQPESIIGSMHARNKPRSFPWNQLIVGLFAVILFAVWWNLRQKDDDADSSGLSPEERAEIIEQEEAINPERSFLNEEN